MNEGGTDEIGYGPLIWLARKEAVLEEFTGLIGLPRTSLISGKTGGFGLSASSLVALSDEPRQEMSEVAEARLVMILLVFLEDEKRRLTFAPKPGLLSSLFSSCVLREDGGGLSIGCGNSIQG